MDPLRSHSEPHATPTPRPCSSLVFHRVPYCYTQEMGSFQHPKRTQKLPWSGPTHRLSWLLACFCLTLHGGCASPDTRMGSEDFIGSYEESTAHGAAYTSDMMTFSKEQKVRPKNDSQFYFKSCELNGDQTFYSKTSYWCSEP